MRAARRLLLLAVLLLLPAAPASAHGPGGDSTSFRSVVTGADPALPAGVQVRVVGVDAFLEVSVDGGTVEVPGYDGEPYLRITDQRVQRNVNSPATWINADRDGGAPVPGHAEAGVDPQWEVVATDGRWRWHDHRIHWMAATDPPAVKQDPRRRAVVNEWAVPLVVDGQAVTVTGQLEYVPPPPPWLVAGGFPSAVGAAAVVGARAPWRTATRAGALAALVVALGVVGRSADDLLAVPADRGEVLWTAGIAGATALPALVGAHRAWHAVDRPAVARAGLGLAGAGAALLAVSWWPVLGRSVVVGEAPAWAVQLLVGWSAALTALAAAVWWRGTGQRTRDVVDAGELAEERA